MLNKTLRGSVFSLYMCSQKRRRMLSVLSMRAANCSARCWRGKICSWGNCPERRRRWGVSSKACLLITHCSQPHTLSHILSLYPCVTQEDIVLRRSTVSSWGTATTAVWRCCLNTSVVMFTESRWVERGFFVTSSPKDNQSDTEKKNHHIETLTYAEI